MDTGYHARYERLKKNDEERNKLIEELLFANDDLASRLDKTTQRLERDSDAVELYQHRSKEAIARFDALQKLATSSTYVCVLIDGEEIFFDNHFTQGAEAEGQDAARLLHGALQEYLSGLGIHQDCDIVVNIYANMYALARKFHDSHGIIDRFVNGFNASYPLFSLIDGGNMPGNVKGKMGQLFYLHIQNLHCKHVVLGASSIDGYANLLESCVGDKKFENRITLLKGPPFAKELLQLSGHFKKTAFPQIFRTTLSELPTGAPRDHHEPRVRTDIAAYQAPEDRFLESLEEDKRRPSVNGVADNDAEERRNYADKERRRPSQGLAGAKPQPDDNAHAIGRRPDLAKAAYPRADFKDAPFGFVALNRKGQRVDVPLSKPDIGTIHDIKTRKVCNDYVFRKKCNNHRCRHEHPSGLSDKEFHALRDIARTFPCPAGVRCNDTLCHSGHRCPIDPCIYIKDRSCRYPPDLHETDTGIVNREDLERFENSSHDEHRILGITSRVKTESSNSPRISRNGEYRNLSVAFENGAKTGSKKVDPPPHPPLTLGKSILNAPAKVSPSNPSPTAASASEPLSPMKRTADEANEADQQQVKILPAAARDPRVGAQKRLRAISPM